MGEQYQLPPGKSHKWEAWWNGKRYVHLPDGTPYRAPEPKKTHTFVMAATAYLALKQASLDMSIPPEFIKLQIKEKEDGDKTEQDIPDGGMGDGSHPRRNRRKSKSKATPGSSKRR